MGGGKLDLRDAMPAGGQAVINIFAMMGGFEIVVPDTWRVIVEVTPLMGGIEDRSRASASPGAPTLVIRGFIMMGGLTLKNP
jgi:predicted membrane protein